MLLQGGGDPLQEGWQVRDPDVPGIWVTQTRQSLTENIVGRMLTPEPETVGCAGRRLSIPLRIDFSHPPEVARHRWCHFQPGDTRFEFILYRNQAGIPVI